MTPARRHKGEGGIYQRHGQPRHADVLLKVANR